MLTPAPALADPILALGPECPEHLNDLPLLNTATDTAGREVSVAAACEPIDLVQGLPVAIVREKLNIGARMQDTGSRLLAFYLVEMDARRLYQDTGHSSAVHYAECKLDMEPRRCRELLAVGKKLLELCRMDEAFCSGAISWTQVVMLTRVVTPEHEEAWLERARESTCRDLALEVKMSRPGSKPRDPEDRKGLAEIRFGIAAQVSGLAFQMWELAKKQLGEERGTPISDAECMQLLAALLLSTEEDGSLPGRKRAQSSLFRLVVHQDASGAGEPRASLETEDGSIPLDQATLTCIQCDAETISEEGEHLVKDSKTSAALRERVLTRDSHRCRSCGSRFELMVHHIHARSQGGRTRARNLITLCMRCHGLVHADLLVLIGEDQANVSFVDRKGCSLHAPGDPLTPSVLTRLDRHRLRDSIGEPMGMALSRSLARQLSARESGAAAPGGVHTPDRTTASGAESPSRTLLTIDDLPAEVDVHWWRKHAHLFDQSKGERFSFKSGFAVESPLPPYLLSEQPATPASQSSSAIPAPSAPSEVSSAPAHDRSLAPWPLRLGHPSGGSSAERSCIADSARGTSFETVSGKTAFERRFRDWGETRPATWSERCSMAQ